MSEKKLFAAMAGEIDPNTHMYDPSKSQTYVPPLRIFNPDTGLMMDQDQAQTVKYPAATKFQPQMSKQEFFKQMMLSLCTQPNFSVYSVSEKDWAEFRNFVEVVFEEVEKFN